MASADAEISRAIPDAASTISVAKRLGIAQAALLQRSLPDDFLEHMDEPTDVDEFSDDDGSTEKQTERDIDRPDAVVHEFSDSGEDGSKEEPDSVTHHAAQRRAVTYYDQGAEVEHIIDEEEDQDRDLDDPAHAAADDFSDEDGPLEDDEEHGSSIDDESGEEAAYPEPDSVKRESEKDHAEAHDAVEPGVA